MEPFSDRGREQLKVYEPKLVLALNIIIRLHSINHDLIVTYRIIKSFEQVASFYTRQLPDNTSQIFNLTSTILVTERVSHN